MKVVLAYSGSAAASSEVASLAADGHEVVTVTLDVGQSEPLEETRTRARASGAVRAHVVDARDSFVRTCVLPAMQCGGTLDLEALAHPLIAQTLADVARIEGADDARMSAYPAAGSPRRERHLLLRPARAPLRAPDAAARVDITLEDGIPVAVNGVTMAPAELVESLSLIAGQHGVTHGEPVEAPAAAVLRAVYAHAPSSSADVRLTLYKGACTVQSAVERGAPVASQS